MVFLGLLSVPSYATLLTLKKSIEQRGNVCPLTQKNLVQLDWVSKEDGSHILTVGVSSMSCFIARPQQLKMYSFKFQVGHRVLLYTAVSNPAVKERFINSKSIKNPKLLTKQTSTVATVLNQEDVTVR